MAGVALAEVMLTSSRGLRQEMSQIGERLDERFIALESQVGKRCYHKERGDKTLGSVGYSDREGGDDASIGHALGTGDGRHGSGDGVSRICAALLETDGIELRGEAQLVMSGGGTCNVLESDTSYEAKKENHGAPMDVWRLDFSVRNGSGRCWTT